MRGLIKTALAATAAILGLTVITVTGLAGLMGAAASGLSLNAAPSRTGLTDIPTRMLALYQQAAATCPGLPWTVLAAIGKVETDHGRDRHQVSSAGAVGPMQFEPATFTEYAAPLPPGGATPPTPWDPVDAVYAAARLLCANGARAGQGHNLPRSIWAYNHDPAYVTHVLHTATTYSTASSIASPANPGPVLPASWAAVIAVAYAHAQLGRPYQWGGTGRGGTGFDCSGLTQAAYAAAGIPLPRTAQQQYDASPHLPAGTPLQPGDLLFYGTPHHVHHVGIYTSAGQMIDAPHPGAPIRHEPIWQADFLGATRPTAPAAGGRS